MTEELNSPETEKITFEEAEFTAAHVANYFLWRAWEEDMEITPMKLLKLVYIAYGWNLVINRQKLFNETIKAWEHGPVVPSLYHEYKNYGKNPIPKGNYDSEYEYDELSGELKLNDIPIIEDKKITKVLSSVWKNYGQRDGIYLSKITHSPSSPWSQVYVKGKNNILRDNDIVNRSLEGIRSLIEKANS